MVAPTLIPFIKMFFDRWLTVFRHRRTVYSLLRFLLEKIIFACNQVVNPSPQVDIFDRRFFLGFSLLSKTILGDRACSIRLSSKPECTEAARISDMLELIKKTVKT